MPTGEILSLAERIIDDTHTHVFCSFLSTSSYSHPRIQISEKKKYIFALSPIGEF